MLEAATAESSPTSSLDGATAKDSAGKVSTMIVTASTVSAANPIEDSAVTRKSPTDHHTSTIAGVTVGVTVGLAAIALLIYLLGRRQKHRALRSSIEKATESSLPSSAVASDMRLDMNPGPGVQSIVYSKAELDTQPNTLAELPASFAELDSSPVATTQVPSELDAASDLDHSASVRRSSVVSPLARSSNHRPAAAGEQRNKTNSQLDVHPATELVGSGVEANEDEMTLRDSEGVQAETAHQDQVTREDVSEEIEVSKQCQDIPRRGEARSRDEGEDVEETHEGRA